MPTKKQLRAAMPSYNAIWELVEACGLRFERIEAFLEQYRLDPCAASACVKHGFVTIQDFNRAVCYQDAAIIDTLRPYC